MALILYLLGIGMTYSYSKSLDDDTKFGDIIVACLWPLVAIGMIGHLIFSAGK